MSHFTHGKEEGQFISECGTNSNQPSNGGDGDCFWHKSGEKAFDVARRSPASNS